MAWGDAVFTWQKYESRTHGGQNSYAIRISDNPHDAPALEVDVLLTLEKAMEWGEKIPIGVLYQTSERNVFGHQFRKTVAGHPLPELDPIDAGEIKRLLQKFRPEAG